MLLKKNNVIVTLFLLFSLFIPRVRAIFIAKESAQIIQKEADNPRDRPIVVRHDDNGFSEADLCYTPSFSGGEGYIYLAYCSSSQQTSWRYDLFGRIGTNIEGKWLCITAPSSITGIGGTSTKRWTNLILRPCVINDSNQKWIIVNHAFYTADGRFRVKDYGYYLYISTYSKDYYDHHLTSIMQDWEKTVARPGNLSIKTPISWLYITPSEWILYYLQNNKSVAGEPVYLYYNPENGHIAQYYTSSGDLYCLTSKMTSTLSWNWVTWENCRDNISREADKFRAWELLNLHDNIGMLADFNGNLLRVMKYGSHWGVPYTVNQNYLFTDISHVPTSEFVFSSDIDYWNRYFYSNLQDSLENCPAPGRSYQQFRQVRKRVIRGLPEDFQLTDAWLGRLWQIATSTDSRLSHQGIGLCGVCLLQTYQMMLELVTQARSGPVLYGGYLFNTAQDTDPFISFQARYPSLSARLAATEGIARRAIFSPTQAFANFMAGAFYGVSTTMLPNYRLRATPMVFTQGAMGLVQRLFREPVGSLWLVVLYRTSSTGQGVTGHAQPLLRTAQGMVLIPTNDNYPLDTFRELSQPISDAQGIINRLTIQGTRTILALQFIAIGDLVSNPLSATLSQYNCTGDGEHRRGNRTPPSSSSINQCSSNSGRCIQ